MLTPLCMQLKVRLSLTALCKFWSIIRPVMKVIQWVRSAKIFGIGHKPSTSKLIFRPQAVANVWAAIGGSIVNFSFISFVIDNSGYASYPAANAGIRGLIYSLERELWHKIFVSMPETASYGTGYCQCHTLFIFTGRPYDDGAGDGRLWWRYTWG